MICSIRENRWTNNAIVFAQKTTDRNLYHERKIFIFYVGKCNKIRVEYLYSMYFELREYKFFLETHSIKCAHDVSMEIDEVTTNASSTPP